MKDIYMMSMILDSYLEMSKKEFKYKSASQKRSDLEYTFMNIKSNDVKGKLYFIGSDKNLKVKIILLQDNITLMLDYDL